MKDLIFNVIFFGTMFQIGATAFIFTLLEDRVMEFSTDAAGLAAFERFLAEFEPYQDTYRKQLSLMHTMEGLAAWLIVIGMFLFGNFRAGHLFAAMSCALFYWASKIVVDTIQSYPQIQGNEAMTKDAPQGILIFAGLAVLNSIAFLASTKPFFPSTEDCASNGKKKS